MALFHSSVTNGLIKMTLQNKIMKTFSVKCYNIWSLLNNTIFFVMVIPCYYKAINCDCQTRIVILNNLDWIDLTAGVEEQQRRRRARRSASSVRVGRPRILRVDFRVVGVEGRPQVRRSQPARPDAGDARRSDGHRSFRHCRYVSIIFCVLEGWKASYATISGWAPSFVQLSLNEADTFKSSWILIH